MNDRDQKLAAKRDYNSAKDIITGCGIAWGVAFALLNLVTNGKVLGNK